MVILDASIVNIALPSIQRGLHFSKDNLPWVVNAYTLAFGGLLLLGGRMADLRGRRRMFIVGLVVLASASLAGGLSASQDPLIASRAVQGCGRRDPCPSCARARDRDLQRGRKALGIWGAVAGSGAAAGVLLGGVLTSGLNWRWVLFVNVPVAILAALSAPRLLSDSRAEATKRSFDLAGAISITAGLTLLVYALIEAQKGGWGAARTIGLLGVAAVLLTGFVVIEQRASAPLMPFSIFRLRAVAGANAVAILVGARSSPSSTRCSSPTGTCHHRRDLPRPRRRLLPQTRPRTRDPTPHRTTRSARTQRHTPTNHCLNSRSFPISGTSRKFVADSRLQIFAWRRPRIPS